LNENYKTFYFYFSHYFSIYFC